MARAGASHDPPLLAVLPCLRDLRGSTTEQRLEQRRIPASLGARIIERRVEIEAEREAESGEALEH
jgi:hypothetical protein